jgi:hypothetical protein
MIVYDVEQGSPEWHKLRRGRPTASNFHRIITGKGMKPSKSMEGYIDELIGEALAIHQPEGAPSYTSRAMSYGVETENEARRWYQLNTEAEVRKVGFITTDDHRFGGSPDALVGPDGGMELKCPTPKVHMSYLRRGGVPANYKAQVHGGLICGAGVLSWWDFVSYCPGLEPVKVRVVRDDFTTELAVCLEIFWRQYMQTLERIKNL